MDQANIVLLSAVLIFSRIVEKDRTERVEVIVFIAKGVFISSKGFLVLPLKVDARGVSILLIAICFKRLIYTSINKSRSEVED